MGRSQSPNSLNRTSRTIGGGLATTIPGSHSSSVVGVMGWAGGGGVTA